MNTFYRHPIWGPHAPPIHVGAILPDIFGTVSETFGDVVDAVPGSEWVKGAVETGALTIRDVANFEVLGFDLGYQILSVISGGLAQGLVPILGPAVINIAIATPGLIAGDDFSTAYTRGVADYLEKAAFVFGGPAGIAGAAGARLADQSIARSARGLLEDPRFRKVMADAGTEIKKRGIRPADALKELGLDPDTLAARFNSRPDATALASNGLLHQDVYDLDNFDPKTGREAFRPSGVPLFWPGPSLGDEVLYYRDRILEARGDRDPMGVIPELEFLLTEAEAEKAGRLQSSSDLGSRLHRFQNRGGDPAYIAQLEQRFQTAKAAESRRFATFLERVKRRRAERARQQALEGKFTISPVPIRLNDLPAALLVTSPLWITLFLLWRKKRSQR